ncbi:porin family protein [Flavobacterium capsici]|uniref:Porin family protein n=1 Tax=Flavobacterium capsici TaxID=3075618 RepID=A0AA96J3Z2_9FLAO|nr:MULTISPECIES: porin family protein [unclassified Flavobacterium]WNM19863.1 porin family protein [Flavobacterium sp. PMR2A8]WNM21252.1 porin family protein [Flavobacterium sp. PMTSA4]
MKKIIFIFSLFIVVTSVAQVKDSTQVERDFDAVDSLYREDQFYFSVSYCLMQNKPDGFKQSKFSPGISLGFLRDMPINKNRTLAFAVGIGYTFSSYNQNIAITPNGDNYDYQIIPSDITFSKDKFLFHTIDLPIEFRWRNSTPESIKFWRVYTGFKLSYLFYDEYKLETSSGNLKISNNKDLNPLQYGVYLSAGWNTVNIYAYYGLNSFFKSDTKIEGKSLDVNSLKFGLMFYIL